TSDDVQLIPPGAMGLGAHSVVIGPGPNGTIESTIAGDDQQEEHNDPRIDGVCAFQSDPVTQIDADGIVAGRNGVADTAASGDDEQLVTVGTTGLPYDTAIVGPGENKVIDTVIN